MERTRYMLRSGAWLTRERVRRAAVALLIAALAGRLYLAVTANGLIDRQGRPLGTDFSNAQAAGTHLLDGDPEAPFDVVRQYAREQRIFGEATPFYGWHYPPFFLFLAAALALMPCGVALVLWQTATLGLYLLSIRAILHASVRGLGSEVPECATPNLEGSTSSDFLWPLLALAFPAVLINIGHGQNGFLTTALLGTALVQIDRRPLALPASCSVFSPTNRNSAQ